MEFIIDNLVWFIAGGVVILMTIIGYFAEKTDFGKNISSSTDDDVKDEEPKKEKVKPTKKEKKSKKEEIKEEFPQNQPLEQEFAAELPIPALSDIPVAIEQQNIVPVVLNPVEVIETDNIKPELDVEPAMQQSSPVDLESNAIEDENIKTQPILEVEPTVPVYQEPVTEISTLLNIIPDELPTIVDEVDEVDDSNLVGQPIAIDEIENNNLLVDPTVIDEVENNNLMDEPINIDETPQVVPEFGIVNMEPIEEVISTLDEKPVVITDEKVASFDNLSSTMEMPDIMMEQGIPSTNLGISNLDTIVQNDEQSDEEDIWKF